MLLIYLVLKANLRHVGKLRSQITFGLKIEIYVDLFFDDL